MARTKDNPGGLFIPGCLLMGMGLGFLFGNVPAGLFTGLGVGFILFAISLFIFPEEKHDDKKD